MEKVMLSVIAVNFNSSAFLKTCVASIISAAGNVPHEFLIVDSGSREEDVTNLLGLRSDNVRIILNRENIGYARGVNTGIKNAKGDFLLITNPDVFYKSGSIQVMLDAMLTYPRCGAVGPKTWWNESMTFLLPSSEPITPCRTFQSELMRVSPALNRVFLRGWIKKNLKYWQSEKPLTQEMLAGACIMTTRRVFDFVGGFDEIFPLYFEDADWCLRVRKAGYSLYTAPRANVIHYYNQSAQQDIAASGEKYRYSLDKYMRKHFSGQLFLLRHSRRLHKLAGSRASAFYDDKGILTEPPVFTFPNGSGKLLLLSPVDSLIPSAGALFEAGSFQIPDDLWGCLEEGTYFVKAMDLDTLQSCGTWRWVKHGSRAGSHK